MSEKLKNIGPKSMAWLRQTGVRSLDDLKAVGALAAFVRIKRAGFRASMNLLYALEGAILDCHWQDIPAARRSELILAADAALALLPQAKGRRSAVVTSATTTPMADEEATVAPAFGFDDPAALEADA